MQHDQLRIEQAAGRAFAPFAEPRVRFRPTYRMERMADSYCQQVKAKLSVQNAPSCTLLPCSFFFFLFDEAL